MKTKTPPMTARALVEHLGGIKAIRQKGESLMIWTDQIGEWPGGPAWIVHQAQLDPQAPEIVLIVRLAAARLPHKQTGEPPITEIGVYDWETVYVIDPESHAEAIKRSDDLLWEFCQREDKLASQARREALKAARERWEKTVPAEAVETIPARLPDLAKARWNEAREYKGDRGFTIVGATGTGKSRVAARMLLAASERGASICWLSCAEIRTRMLATIDGASRIFNQATGSRVLVLDDIGHGLGMEQADALLLSIVTYRANHKRPTITTTQFSAAALISRFASQETGEAVVRRIGQQYATPWDFGKINQGGTEA
jgi:DNA replication protein DnaC